MPKSVQGQLMDRFCDAPQPRVEKRATCPCVPGRARSGLSRSPVGARARADVAVMSRYAGGCRPTGAPWGGRRRAFITPRGEPPSASLLHDKGDYRA